MRWSFIHEMFIEHFVRETFDKDSWTTTKQNQTAWRNCQDIRVNLRPLWITCIPLLNASLMLGIETDVSPYEEDSLFNTIATMWGKSYFNKVSSIPTQKYAGRSWWSYKLVSQFISAITASNSTVLNERLVMNDIADSLKDLASHKIRPSPKIKMTIEQQEKQKLHLIYFEQS
jgi:hypothetical protein